MMIVGQEMADIRHGGGGCCTVPFTLATRGLEELFFQLWFCVSFWFWQEVPTSLGPIYSQAKSNIFFT